MDPIRPRRRRIILGLGSAVAGSGLLRLLSSDAHAAETYPQRSVRMVVPYTPGGGADLVGRMLADGGLSRELGQSVVIDNKPGAGTVIGSDFVAKSPADGYTVLVISSALTINATLVKKLPYDTEKDFESIAMLCSGPNVLACLPDKPFKSVQDVIAAARAAPGRLTYGSSGIGTTTHLSGELFKNMAKVDLTHVPYKGAAPSFTDLLGGQVDFVIATSGAIGRFISSGRMRAIAITSANRSSTYPGVQTIGESVPAYSAEVWYGLYAPAGTPSDVVNRLNGAARAASDSPLFRSRIEGEGLKVSVSSPQELSHYTREEIVRWRKVILDAKITAE